MLKFGSAKKRPRPDVQIESVAGFVDHVVKWRLSGHVPTVFRGQRHFGWHSTPKLFRDDNSVYENEHHAVRDIVSLHPSEFESDRTMFDRLVRMQHFGLPTRLMDVTTNPLVALWFATEESNNEDEYDGAVQALLIPPDRRRYYDSDRVSCMANLANLTKKQKDVLKTCAIDNPTVEAFNKEKIVDILVFHIGMEKPHFRNLVNPGDLSLPVYVKPKMSNKRIVAQSGAFILWGLKEIPTSTGTRLKQDRVWILEKHKPIIRKELSLLGIDERTLFPEIDKSAKYITDLYGSAIKGRGHKTSL